MTRRYLVTALVCFGLGIVCLALVGCSLKSAQIAHVGAQSADLVSTHGAESRGAVEANPFMRVSWPARIVLKSAATATVLYLTEQIGREHQVVAKTLLTTINAVLVGVVVSNLRIAR